MAQPVYNYNLEEKEEDDNDDDDDEKDKEEAPSLFHRQWIHLGFSIIALPALIYFVNVTSADNAMTKTGLGMPVIFWFYIALAVPVIHCIYVWLCWRAELNWHSITRKWGGNNIEEGFEIYFRLFFFQFGMRFISLLLLAIADANSETVVLKDRIWLRIVLAVPIVAVGGYTMYSVKAYWGSTTKESFSRAAGKDHFDPENAHGHGWYIQIHEQRDVRVRVANSLAVRDPSCKSAGAVRGFIQCNPYLGSLLGH